MSTIINEVYHGGRQVVSITGKNPNTGGLVVRTKTHHVEGGQYLSAKELIDKYASDLTDIEIDSNVGYTQKTVQETLLDGDMNTLYIKQFSMIQEDEPAIKIDKKQKTTDLKN